MGKQTKVPPGAGLSGRDGQMGFDWPATQAHEPVAPPSHTPANPPIPDETAGDSPPLKASEAGQLESVEEAADPEGSGYRPNHPWHYYHLGDNAPPVPIDQIAASDGAAQALAKDLPKAPAKRMVRVRELLESERRELQATAARYQDVIERGAAALSDYDRNIAHGGNEDLARASTLAILYTRVARHRGRLALLEKEAARGGYLGR